VIVAEGVADTLEDTRFGREADQNGGQERYCFGCYGRDADNIEDPDCNHRYVGDCPLMSDLVNRGYIHKVGREWCRGPWNPDRPSAPIMFRNDRRWFDQAKAHVSGGEYDFDLDARAKNVERMRIEAEIAARERGREAEQRGSLYGSKEIIQRDPAQGINIGGRCVGVLDEAGAELGDWYEDPRNGH
jgi:hypothetical protein